MGCTRYRKILDGTRCRHSFRVGSRGEDVRVSHGIVRHCGKVLGRYSLLAQLDLDSAGADGRCYGVAGIDEQASASLLTDKNLNHAEQAAVEFSSLFLLVFWPILLAIAIAIKLDSPGPALYRSKRIGKKGRVFHCIKFRTMVQDAEVLRSEVEYMNARDRVLFKIANDPRITQSGRFLRKYSLDELPQLFNVLKGDMNIVGPRPPIASEVREY